MFVQANSIQQSEEVEAYPLVLELIHINWAERAQRADSSSQALGYGLPANYSKSIREDYEICTAIARVSGIYCDSDVI